MVEGKKRSRTFRRSRTRLPAGRNVIHYSKRKVGRAQCANCGENLKGVPQVRPNQMKKLAKSERRPSRPYGGVLCSRCTRATIVSKVRSVFTLSQ